MKNSYYTVDQVAGLLDMHVKTIRRYIREGKLKANKVGKQWRVTEHNLSLFTQGDIPEENDNIEIINENIYSTHNNTKIERKINVSSVVEIDVLDFDDASKISNSLIAVMNNKDPKYGKSSIKVQFLQKDKKIRIILWGGLDFMEVMMSTISQLSN